MGFGENLQFLRKQNNITQEQLAERLAVSRQSVSKWESESSYPEMEKLLQLCDLFSCNLDTLLRGDVQNDLRRSNEEYDRHMKGFSRSIAGGVALVLLGVTILLFTLALGLHEGLSVILLFAFLIPAVILFVLSGINHDSFLKYHPDLAPFYSEEETLRFQKKFAAVLASAIGLILFGVILILSASLFPEPNDQIALLLTSAFMLCVTIGASAIVYVGVLSEKYHHTAEKQEKGEDSLADRLSGCIMLTATALFLLLGFLWDLWHISWIAFPIGGILCGIVSIIFPKKQ